VTLSIPDASPTGIFTEFGTDFDPGTFYVFVKVR
jgi:hypothetical protein